MFTFNLLHQSYLGMVLNSTGDAILFGILLLIIGIPLAILPYILVAKVAERKGFGVASWLIVSFFLGWITLIILAFLDPVRSTKVNNFHPKPQHSYQPYKCASCEETITTKKCGYCGFENTPSKTRMVPITVISKFQNNTITGGWNCPCGANNSDKATECSVCFAPRRK